MQQRGETLTFTQHMALDQYIYRELQPVLQRKKIYIKLILNTPPALMPISEIIYRRGDTGDCGVLGILGILGSGEIALCGIGRNVPKLVYGRLGEDSIRSLWFEHPTILELRRILTDVKNYPGVCGQCAMATYCRTGCIAQHYVDSRQLVWPDSLCEEARREGLFPITRQKIELKCHEQY